MAITKNESANSTGAIANEDGMVYTVGYNANGEMGNGTIESLVIPWCISDKKINVAKNVINFTQAEQTEKIEYNMSMAFNLLINEVPGDTCTFMSMDENIAIVDENTGVVTAKSIGSTYVKLYNKENDLWAAVKINVNGESNSVQPKIVGGGNHFVALKANGSVWTYGYNGYGQLGNGNNVNQTEPVIAKAQIELENGEISEEEITDAIDVSAGYNFTLILSRK